MVSSVVVVGGIFVAGRGGIKFVVSSVLDEVVGGHGFASWARSMELAMASSADSGSGNQL